jgi:transcriptional regulator with XRE-family HTH domain
MFIKSQALIYNHVCIRYNEFMDWSEWINRKYIEFRGDSRKTISDYAEYLGVSQPLLSQWMGPKPKKPTSQVSISKLAAKYGVEVYEVLGLPVPADEIPLDQLPEDLQADLRGFLYEVPAALDAAGVDAESETGKNILKELMAKYGFTRIEKK